MSLWISYIYTFLVQFRVTRIVNILFITQILGMRLTEFAILESIYAASQFAMEVPSGYLGDKVGKKITVVLGLVFSSISQLVLFVCGACSDDSIFIIIAMAFVLDGVAHALLSGADDALIFENLRSDALSDIYDKIRGECQLVGAITLGVATAIGGFLYAIHPCLPYICQAAASTIAIIPILLCHEDRQLFSNERSALKQTLNSLYEVRTNSILVYMVIFTCLSMSTINTIFGIMPSYTESIGFSSSQNGILFMLLSFIGGFVASKAYKLSQKSNLQLTIIVAIMLNTGAILINFVDYKLIVFVGLSFLYVVIDVIDPIAMKVFQMEIEDNVRATFLSLVSFLISAGSMILYPILAFGVENIGMSHMLLIIAIVLTFVLLFICAASKKRKTENEVSEVN